MHNKLFCYIVLCSLVLTLVSAGHAKAITGPNGNTISEAEIMKAYQHVADTLAFVNAMEKFDTKKLVYHNDGGYLRSAFCSLI